MSAIDMCPFCKIVSGDIPAREVHRDEHVVAFHDLNPQAPVHVLVIPTRHAEHLTDFVTSSEENELARLLTVASQVGGSLGRDGYRVVINEGIDAGQTVHHLHLHVLAGRALGWPPG